MTEFKLSRPPETFESVGYCGFCDQKVSASIEERKQHMFACERHPASELIAALRSIRGLARDVGACDFSEACSAIEAICDNVLP